jgi:CelD/BcsL family acetyltransferase involved in cellulose biosynthesis
MSDLSAHRQGMAGDTMAAAAPTAARPRRQPLAGARSGFVATTVPVEAMLAELARSPELVAGTAYQTACWLGAWYTALGTRPEVAPLAVAVRAATDGRLALFLPLIAVRSGGLRTVEFADLGVTDYNLPILGPAAPGDQAGAVALWQAARACLPSADLARLAKMPAKIAGRANPLALLPGVAPSPVFGNLIEVGDDYRQWQQDTLDGFVRNDLRRAARRFERHPGAMFLRVRDLATARRVYEDLRAMQRRRAAEAGFAYRLDEPAYDAVYRQALEAGLGDGSVVLTALSVGEETVAASFAISDGRSCAMLRIADAGGDWRRKCMVGRLLMDRTMAQLHEAGYRLFDLALGDQFYKRRIGARPIALVELTQALSPRGAPQLALDRARAFVRTQPALALLGQRLRNAGANLALLARRMPWMSSVASMALVA